MCFTRSSTMWRLALLLVSALSVRVVDAGMIDKDGMAEWEICAMCHGANGISAMSKFPILAGQKTSYIVQQFGRFSRGERTNDSGQMQGITTEVEPSAVAAIAEYFASLDPPEKVALDAAFKDENVELIQRGGTLFNKGRAGVLACAACHADKDSSAPWIDGQHRDYVYKQLVDFAAGRRLKSNGHGGEGSIHLSDKDMAAVAFYVSTLWLVRD